ncbi:hypothetical protein D3H35_18140 [Cohnella faecalis]|uniref:Uncharacterized protein n=1 Tax=Cohnella faecalis TaxID=2315694 RepID=A0A398CIP0_9BACL|nr:hypothetical protein D3H35_18140 [Cohnella faecalis]
MSSDNSSRRMGSAPSFAHLRRLTDDTGLLEHALGRVPRRREGYTTDDNARALWTVTEWLSLASHRKKTDTIVGRRTNDSGTAADLARDDQAMEFGPDEDRSRNDRAMEVRSDEDRLRNDRAMETRSDEDRLRNDRAMGTRSDEDRLRNDRAMETRSDEDRLRNDRAMETRSDEDRLRNDRAMETRSDEERLRNDRAMEMRSDEDRLRNDRAMETRSDEERLRNDRAMEICAEKDGKMTAEQAGTLSALAEIYMAFLLWSQHDDGWWHNNIAYDRTPEPEELSHDCQGRAFWACADAWVRLEGPLRETARIMIEKSLQTIMRIDSLRGRAFAMAACAHLLDADESGTIQLPDDWRQLLKQQMKRLEQLMNEAFRHFADDSWRWFEPAMTYSNGIPAWALLRTYRVTQKPETLKNGLDSLAYLLDTMTAEEGWLRPVGNDGWCTNETISRWDQQPLEMFKLALALEEAALAVEAARYDESRLVASGVSSTLGTSGGSDSANSGSLGSSRHSGSSGSLGSSRHSGSLVGASWPGLVQSHRGSDMADTRYLREMRDLCLSWFYGENDLQVPMIDCSDGSCCDGLAEHGPNLNCGAEAAISYLMTEAICRRERA